MKKLTVKKGTQCMACLECVRACSEAFYKEFDPSKACLQIIDRNGAAKPMVCVQCGKCAEACEHGAITQNAKGVYTINKKLCAHGLQVHRLRHLRQGMSDGNPRGRREISSMIHRMPAAFAAGILRADFKNVLQMNVLRTNVLQTDAFQINAYNSNFGVVSISLFIQVHNKKKQPPGLQACGYFFFTIKGEPPVCW